MGAVERLHDASRVGGSVEITCNTNPDLSRVKRR